MYKYSLWSGLQKYCYNCCTWINRDLWFVLNLGLKNQYLTVLTVNKENYSLSCVRCRKYCKQCISAVKLMLHFEVSLWDSYTHIWLTQIVELWVSVFHCLMHFSCISYFLELWSEVLIPVNIFENESNINC